MEEDNNLYAKAGLPTPIDLPTQTELPSVSASIEKADMMMGGYSDGIPYNPNIPSPSIQREPISRTREYVNRLRNNTLLSFANPEGDTFSKIINEQNSKIDITGGWAKKSDAYEKLNNGQYSPKYEYYMPGVDNDALNASMQTNTEKFSILSKDHLPNLYQM